MNLYNFFAPVFANNKNRSFIWDSKKQKLQVIKKIDSINLEILIGIENQKQILIKNTENFAKGNLTNNALLWGTRGNGKSTLIKSVFIKISNKYKNIKLIQLNKKDIFDIEKIYTYLSKYNRYRFVVFIDDLSFEKIDSDYKIIKSSLDGSILNQPKNVILYITSNRRHLMPRDMIDNERSSAIHTDESIEEKISLSDRFGLWIGFHNLSQNDFVKIIKKYCEHYQIKYSEDDIKNAIKWSLQRGNRTGRTAYQYIIELASQRNLRIKF